MVREARGRWVGWLGVGAGRALLVSSGLLGVAPLLGGCGEPFETAEPGCEANIDECGADQTCWPNQGASAFVCLPSPDEGGEVGEPCRIVGGSASCAHGLFCYRLAGQDEGTCSPRCDPEASASTCASGACARLSVGNVGVIGVCQR